MPAESLAGAGVASPFWPRFFETRALSPQEIGIVLAAAMLTRLLAGPIVGMFADRAEYGVTLTISPATKRPETGDLRSRSKKGGPPIDGPAHATRPGRRMGGPWGSRPPPRAPENILVSDEAAARARALEGLRRLLGAARYVRRAPDPTDLTYGSSMPVMAGGCLRAVLLVMLFCSWRLTTAWLNCHPLCCSYAHQFRTSTSG